MKMKTTVAIIVGALAGLYFFGLYIKRKNKGQRNSIDNYSENKQKPQKKNVNFELLETFTYEELFSWFNETDLPDFTEDKYLFAIIRYNIKNPNAVFDSFDVSKMSDTELSNILGMLILDNKTKTVVNDRFIICSNFDNDILSLFEKDDLIILD
jgi:hypothetical protein